MLSKDQELAVAKVLATVRDGQWPEAFGVLADLLGVPKGERGSVYDKAMASVPQIKGMKRCKTAKVHCHSMCCAEEAAWARNKVMPCLMQGGTSSTSWAR